MHHNGVQKRELGFDRLEQPYTDIFGSGIGKELNPIPFSQSIEAIVVQIFNKGLHHRLDIGKVEQHAQFRVDITFHLDFHTETVAVHAAAFVPLGKGRDEMGRLKRKLLGDDKWHNGGEVTKRMLYLKLAFKVC